MEARPELLSPLVDALADRDSEKTRALLVVDSMVPEIRLSRRQQTPRLVAAMAVLGLGFALGGVIIGWIVDDLVTGLMTGGAVWAAAVLAGMLGQFASYSGAKRLHILGSTGTLILGERRLSFDDLMATRRVDRLERIVQTEPGGPTEAPIPFVVIAHRTEDEIALRGGQHDFEEQDALADHINAIIAEYHLRKAAREWLALDDAGGSTPYRRTEP